MQHDRESRSAGTGQVVGDALAGGVVAVPRGVRVVQVQEKHHRGRVHDLAVGELPTLESDRDRAITVTQNGRVGERQRGSERGRGAFTKEIEGAEHELLKLVDVRRREI